MRSFTRLARANSSCLIWKWTFTTNIFRTLTWPQNRSEEESAVHCSNSLTTAQTHIHVHTAHAQGLRAGTECCCFALSHFIHTTPCISQVRKQRHTEAYKLPGITEPGNAICKPPQGAACKPVLRADTRLHLDLSAHPDFSVFWFCKRCTFTKEIGTSERQAYEPPGRFIELFTKNKYPKPLAFNSGSHSAELRQV